MDPNANLSEQRRLAAEILALQDEMTRDERSIYDQRAKHASYAERYQELADQLAELVQALDAWIGGGGFLPASWARLPE